MSMFVKGISATTMNLPAAQPSKNYSDSFSVSKTVRESKKKLITKL